MNGYQTEQKKLLLAYLSRHADEAFSSADLAKTLGECGVGKSTVYRLIAQLCEEGVLRRFSRAGGGLAYQYLGSDGCTGHLHLRCTACGHVTHLADAAASPLGALLENEYGFCLNEGRTVLLGICADCRKTGETL